MLKLINVPKFSAKNPSSYQFSLNFYCQTHPLPQIHDQNPSKPFCVPKFRDFWGNDPPMCVHFRFKTHPCSSSIRIYENMRVPPEDFLIFEIHFEKYLQNMKNEMIKMKKTHPKEF